MIEDGSVLNDAGLRSSFNLFDERSNVLRSARPRNCSGERSEIELPLTFNSRRFVIVFNFESSILNSNKKSLFKIVLSFEMDLFAAS